MRSRLYPRAQDTCYPGHPLSGIPSSCWVSGSLVLILQSPLLSEWDLRMAQTLPHGASLELSQGQLPDTACQAGHSSEVTSVRLPKAVVSGPRSPQHLPRRGTRSGRGVRCHMAWSQLTGGREHPGALQSDATRVMKAGTSGMRGQPVHLAGMCCAEAASSPASPRDLCGTRAQRGSLIPWAAGVFPRPPRGQPGLIQA